MKHTAFRTICMQEKRKYYFTAAKMLTLHLLFDGNK